ncbi:unnamed protein product [Amoebophrya sp. A25]|nr:unnamed protein product [Amoebophrya sp. A25]|eukprot:GSA25T00018734001.1
MPTPVEPSMQLLQSSIAPVLTYAAAAALEPSSVETSPSEPMEGIAPVRIDRTPLLEETLLVRDSFPVDRSFSPRSRVSGEMAASQDSLDERTEGSRSPSVHLQSGQEMNLALRRSFTFSPVLSNYSSADVRSRTGQEQSQQGRSFVVEGLASDFTSTPATSPSKASAAPVSPPTMVLEGQHVEVATAMNTAEEPGQLILDTTQRESQSTLSLLGRAKGNVLEFSCSKTTPGRRDEPTRNPATGSKRAVHQEREMGAEPPLGAEAPSGEVSSLLPAALGLMSSGALPPQPGGLQKTSSSSLTLPIAASASRRPGSPVRVTLSECASFQGEAWERTLAERTALIQEHYALMKQQQRQLDSSLGLEQPRPLDNDVPMPKKLLIPPYAPCDEDFAFESDEKEIHSQQLPLTPHIEHEYNNNRKDVLDKVEDLGGRASSTSSCLAHKDSKQLHLHDESKSRIAIASQQLHATGTRREPCRQQREKTAIPTTVGGTMVETPSFGRSGMLVEAPSWAWFSDASRYSYGQETVDLKSESRFDEFQLRLTTGHTIAPPATCATPPMQLRETDTTNNQQATQTSNLSQERSSSAPAACAAPIQRMVARIEIWRMAQETALWALDIELWNEDDIGLFIRWRLRTASGPPILRQV